MRALLFYLCSPHEEVYKKTPHTRFLSFEEACGGVVLKMHAHLLIAPNVITQRQIEFAAQASLIIQNRRLSAFLPTTAPREHRVTAYFIS